MSLRSNLFGLRRLVSLGTRVLGKELLQPSETPEVTPAGNAIDTPADPTESYRYEIKYTIDPIDWFALEAEIRCHPAAFRRAYPARTINSIYFDTPGYRDLHDNVAGLPDRSKLRVRWYGSEQENVAATLEHKVKRGLLGTKNSAPLANPIDLDRLSWRALRAVLASETTGDLRHAVEESSLATVLIRYNREYFVSADDNVRLTIDRNIEAFDQTDTLTPNFRHRIPAEPAVVIELKADAKSRDSLVAACNALPLRASAHSKYTTALISLIE